MALLDEYTDGSDSDFGNKIVAAMSRKATDYLQNAPTPSAMSLKFAKYILGSVSPDVLFVGRAFASVGINNGSIDSVIQNAVDSNFETLAKLFDPDVFSEGI